MQHIQGLRSHPHRELIVAGIGAAALVGLYTCYRCCCRRQKVAPKTFEGERSKSFSMARSVKSTVAAKNAIYVEEVKSSVKREGGEEQESATKHCPPAPLLGVKDIKTRDALKNEGGTVCAICEQYLSGKTAAPVSDSSKAPEDKAGQNSKDLSTTEEGKENKPYVDGNKYLSTVHPPANLVCPPARVGISAFMDTRPQSTMPTVYSKARSYLRDRWYRGNTYSLPPLGPAYLHASRYPAHGMRVRCSARPGKMLRVINRA